MLKTIDEETSHHAEKLIIKKLIGRARRKIPKFLSRVRYKTKYFLYHFIVGISGYTAHLPAKYWHPTRLSKGKSSPSRTYLNCFLISEILNIVPSKKIDLLDVGCGSGYVRKILTEAGYTGRYTGIDLTKHRSYDLYDTNSFESTLILSKIEDLNTDRKFNVVISLTALEHIEDDTIAVSKCDALLATDGVQIHVVPTFWSLFLFFIHGYRQYNPKRIKRLFKDRINKVYKLGGLFSFFLHFFFITIPFYVFKTDKLRDLNYYPQLMRICNRFDKYLPFCPALYVIVARP